jgi:hypothetical protein
MVLSLRDNVRYVLQSKKRIANVAPGILAGEVTTVEQTMLITPTVTATQLTSITTGVTINGTKGMITTFSANTAGLAASTFTVTNTSMSSATANVEAYISDYAGTILTNGVPSVIVKNRTATGFDIVIYNAHATNALSGVLNIGFEIKA